MLADLDADGTLEIVAAAMDRHVYAWRSADSTPAAPGGAAQVAGYPVLVVDPAKVESIAPTTHAVTFKADAASKQQGAIVATPAVGDIDDDDREGANETPEIIVGTNEEYGETAERRHHRQRDDRPAQPERPARPGQRAPLRARVHR